jgi:hypothetical protein
MPIKQKISGIPKRAAHKQLAPKRISSVGRKLLAIRRDIEKSGMPLLGDEEIARYRDSEDSHTTSRS